MFSGEQFQLNGPCSLNEMHDYQKKSFQCWTCFQKEHRDVFCFVTIIFHKGRIILLGGTRGREPQT